MDTVPISLGDRSYDVVLGHDLLPRLGPLVARRLPKSKRAVVVTSADIHLFYGRKVVESLAAAGIAAEVIELPESEGAKTMLSVTAGLARMAQLGLDRSSIVVALGGGAIGDAAGFLAGIYMRGLPLVQVPTTLLAMVDSSVGGKTGVNLPEGKNLVGVFHQPSLVVVDPVTLRSLRGRDLRAGTAEIIKTGVIADADLFAAVAKGVPQDWTPLIRRCVEIKGAIVSRDERETSGQRALLNFGHTIGHAIEAAAGYGGLLHGEAISIGMVAAAYLSMKHASLSQDTAVAIASALEAHNLPLALGSVDVGAVKQHLSRDKKFVEGRMRFVLTPRIGEAFVSEDVTPADIDDALAMVAE